MDPDEALRRIRALCTPGPHPEDPTGDELSELVAGLDDWLSKGGYLPGPWQAARLLVPAPYTQGPTLLDRIDPLGPAAGI